MSAYYNDSQTLYQDETVEIDMKKGQRICLEIGKGDGASDEQLTVTIVKQ